MTFKEQSILRPEELFWILLRCKYLLREQALIDLWKVRYCGPCYSEGLADG